METGQLFLINVSMEHKTSNEITRSSFLIVANNEDEISSRFTYQSDISDFKNVLITNVQKIKKKMYLLSSNTTTAHHSGNLHIERDDGTKEVVQGNVLTNSNEYIPKIFSVGLTTRVVAQDERHAMRKIGSYLHSANTAGGEKTNSPLFEGTKIIIEEVAKSSGFAMPRDVTNESNSAHIYRN